MNCKTCFKKCFINRVYCIYFFPQFYISFFLFILFFFFFFCMLLSVTSWPRVAKRKRNQKLTMRLNMFGLAAVKLLQNTIKNHNYVTNVYPNTDKNFTVADKEFASKPLITLSYWLRFAVSYDKISLLVNFNEHTHYLRWLVCFTYLII